MPGMRTRRERRRAVDRRYRVQLEQQIAVLLRAMYDKGKKEGKVKDDGQDQ